MPHYTRLKEPVLEMDDSEDFDIGEVGMNFIHKIADADGEAALAHSSETERAEQQKSNRDHIYTVPSTEILSSKKLQFSNEYTDHRRAQEQQEQEQQNIENGNPNVCSLDSTTQPAVVAVCSHSSTASGASLQEQQGRVRGGASVTGRWVGSSIEDRSSKWRAAEYESYHSDNATSVLDYDRNSNCHVPSSRDRNVEWIPSTQRVPSYREPALDHQSQEPYAFRSGTQVQYPQPQDKHTSTSHSSCNDGRYCQRISKEPSPREGLFNAAIPGPQRRTPPSVQHPKSDAAYGGCFSQERSASFRRSNSARDAPGLQRSSSTRDTPGQRSEMSIENWMEHPASRSAHVSDRNKHRVSFSLTENHEPEVQRQRERWREPTAHSKSSLSSKRHPNQQQQPLRYNYEQPGFVEHEKESVCEGKAYTIYGVKELKECAKASSGRHHQFVRAFSLREDGSNYTKIPRAYSVNAGGRHAMPMECDTCGKGGIDIVFLGLPWNEASVCKTCKSSSGSGYSCSDKPPKKKKSIVDYCRKLLRFPQKPR